MKEREFYVAFLERLEKTEAQVAYDMTSEEKQTQELNSFRNIP